MITWLLRATVLFALVLTSMQEAVSKPDYNNEESLLNTIMCPAIPAQYVNSLNLCGANLTIANPTSTDPNCVIVNIFNSYNNTNNASDFYPVGITTVTFTVVFTNAQSVTCSIDVNVVDAQAPFLDCPPSNPLICTILELPIILTLDEFLMQGGIAEDNCVELDTLSFTHFSDTVLNPGNCPLMVNREYRINDSNGQQGSCIQLVTINDTTLPSITCPANVNLQTINCEEDVVIPVPATGDNCVVNSVVNDFNGTDNASDLYPVGTTVVTYTVTDDCGNFRTCSFNVVITETVNPIAICMDATVILDDMGNGFLDPADVNNNSTDNCDINLDLSLSQTTFDCDDIGTVVPVVLTVTDDSGNTDTCVANVTVVDDMDPVVTCPADINNECGSITAAYVDLAEFLAAGGTASDNCEITSFTLIESSNGMSCPETLSRVYIVEDAAGNMGTCTQFIIINDTMDPTFTLPGDITIQCNESTDPFNTGSISNVDDSCPSNVNLVVAFFDNDAPGACPQNKTITRTWSVTDDCGNTATGNQIITVEDSTDPIVTTNASDANVECDGSGNLIELNAWLISNAGAVATDNCGMITWSNNFVALSDGCGATGSASVTFTVMDECGNTASTTASFTISDNIDPILMGVPANIPNIACSDAFPQFVVTADDACGMATVETDTMYDATKLCDISALGYFVSYIWNPVDACGNMGGGTQKSFFVLRDDQPPVFVSCPPNLEVPMSDGLCEFSGIIDPPEVMDNCTEVTFTYSLSGGPQMQTPLIGNFPIGTILDVTWFAVDECGNVATPNCSQIITIIDIEAPSCAVGGDRDILVLDGNGEGIYNISSLEVELTGQDNCTPTLTAFILRMDDPCGDPDNLVEGEEISVCCADVGEVMFIVRVYDDDMNVNECMVELIVQDNSAPVVLRPLPDVSISCDYVYTDLAEFGTYVSDDAMAQTYMITGNPDYQDGLVSDNCGIDSIGYEVVEDLECDNGTITKNFVFFDINGNMSTTSQVISIVNTDPFTENDIGWPANFTITSGCVTSSPAKSLTGEPTIAEKPCSMVGVSFSDIIFDNPASGCPLIRRTWRVMDWCQFETNSGTDEGVWEYDQTIFVENSVMPTFTCPSTHEVCINPVTCKGAIDLKMSATDDCTKKEHILYNYQIDFENNGTIDLSGIGDSIPGVFDPGVYRIKWYADDICGNVASCETLLTIRDCKNPLAVCLNGISIDLNEMPVMGIVAVVWASEFNIGSSDNCSATSTLIYSFSDDVDSTSMVLTCEDRGRQDIEMWVTDEAGNQSFCRTYIIVQDNKELCPQVMPRISIEGAIRSYSNENLEEVKVDLESEENITIDITDKEGSYAFEELEMYQDYKLKPSMEDKYLNGVSTLDLVLIQRHILGLELLDSPYKIIAADANNSFNVDAIDLITIRKLILGIYDEFIQTPSWRFVDAMQDYPDPLQPWSYATEMSMLDLDHSALNMDFVGIKTADVNGTAEVNLMGNSSDNRKAPFGLIVSRYNYKTEFLVERDINTYGFQLAIEGLDESVNLSSSLIDITNENYRFIDGVLMISWNSSEMVSIDAGQALFQIDRNIEKDLEIKELDIEAEIYDEHYDVFQINLNTDTRIGDINEFEVMAISPNPFTDYARIDLHVPSEGEVNFELVNVDGKAIYSATHVMMTGNNSLTIDKTQLENFKGVIYCIIKYDNQTITKTVIRI